MPRPHDEVTRLRRGDTAKLWNAAKDRKRGGVGIRQASGRQQLVDEMRAVRRTICCRIIERRIDQSCAFRWREQASARLLDCWTNSHFVGRDAALAGEQQSERNRSCDKS